MKEGQKANTLAGTNGGIAPEILTSEEYTEITDIFSLGVILFKMLYGESPYEASSEVRYAQLVKN